jgi:hypothetical protein
LIRNFIFPSILRRIDVMNSYRPWLYGALLFAFSASVWITVRDERPLSVVPVPHFSAGATASSQQIRGSSGALAVSLPVRDFPEPPIWQEERDPFAVHNSPAPVPPPPSAPVLLQHTHDRAPSAPALPFEFRGILTDSDGRWLVQLTRDKDYLSVEQGEIIDSTYRVDALNEETLKFTYLPLDIVQYLAIASSSPP